jgi:hypothetical protein
MLLAVIAVKCSEKTAREAAFVAGSLGFRKGQEPRTASKNSEKYWHNNR